MAGQELIVRPPSAPPQSGGGSRWPPTGQLIDELLELTGGDLWLSHERGLMADGGPFHARIHMRNMSLHFQGETSTIALRKLALAVRRMAGV